MVVRNLICSILLIFIFGDIMSQDAEFSQFYANKLYLNPSFAGVEKCPNISINSRKQWSDINNGIFTNSVSYNQYSEVVKGGIGVIFFNDNVSNGLMINNQISLIYSHILPINKKYSISFGIQPTYINKRIDYDRFVFGDQLDISSNSILPSNEALLNESIHLFDVSSGILFYSEDLFVGVSAYHLTEPNESFGNYVTNLPVRLGVNMGYNIYFNKRNKYKQTITLTPSFLFRKQAGFTQYNLGMYLNYGIFVIGIWNRFGDSMIHSIGFEYKKIKFGYSFDYSINDYNNSGTSHETSLNIKLPCKVKRRKFRPLSCPSF